MNRLLYRESEKCPQMPAHTQIRLSYSRALVQPCLLHDCAPRRSHRKIKPAETPATQAQASRASWPDQSDQSLQITRQARDLQLRDPTKNRFTDIQRTLTTYKIDQNQNEVRPPAAAIHSHQQKFTSSHPRAPVVAPWGLQPQ